ncbi:hypothetical protein LR48_Vigan05g079000 [Vigna angularis]|uniref:Uncharacterized protein n=1 Tax=Phaseolus angularis TaxID=3914 RepID=A0A0L9UKH0_PHAAN|nr:hypothetical protein LR48_Vigan05g079000 [Vigna angularis]
MNPRTVSSPFFSRDCHTFSRDIRRLPSSLTDIQSPSLTSSCSLLVQPLPLLPLSFTLSLVRHSLLLASPILPESLLTITLRRSRYYCLCPSVPLSVTPSRVGISGLSETNAALEFAVNSLLGLVIERIQDSISEEDKRLIYLGDGSGDYCPSLRLKEKDFMMPRKNFPLWDLICRDPSLLKAEFHGWRLFSLHFLLLQASDSVNHCS